MKKGILLTLGLLMFVFFTAIPVSAGGGIMVTIDGEMMNFTQSQGYPTIVEGSTLVPLRAIFEALGAEVEYETATRSITATKAQRNIKLTVDNRWAIVKVQGNAKTSELNVPPTLIDGRTYVPLRFEKHGDGSFASEIKSVVIE